MHIVICHNDLRKTFALIFSILNTKNFFGNIRSQDHGYRMGRFRSHLKCSQLMVYKI